MKHYYCEKEYLNSSPGIRKLLMPSYHASIINKQQGIKQGRRKEGQGRTSRQVAASAVTTEVGTVSSMADTAWRLLFYEGLGEHKHTCLFAKEKEGSLTFIFGTGGVVDGGGQWVVVVGLDSGWWAGHGGVGPLAVPAQKVPGC